MKRLFLSLTLISALLLILASCSTAKSEFNISFIVDGRVYSTVVAEENAMVDFPTEPKKEGYTFGGWFRDRNTWKEPFFANSLLVEPITSDTSVYAKWVDGCNHVDVDDDEECDACGTEFSDGKTLPEDHTHSYTVETVDPKYLATEADCENAATYYRTCECGMLSGTTFSYGQPKGHSYTEMATDAEFLAMPTPCGSVPLYYYSCACGDVGTETFKFGEVLEHSYTEKNTSDKYFVSAADCENAAKYYYSCTCGEIGSETFENGAPKGHRYREAVTDLKYLSTPARCGESATYYYSCTCGKAGTRTFNYTTTDGHYFTEKVASEDFIATEAGCETVATYYYSCTCGKCGTDTFKSGEPKGHSHVVEAVDSAYLKKKATEYYPAVYWKTCHCGNASTTETFTYGEVLPGYLTYKLSANRKFYIVTGFVGIDEHIVIPKTNNSLPVCEISANAFKDNTTLKSIELPSSINAIGTHAFSGCVSLESFAIPAAVTSVPHYMFSDCTSLKNVTLHSGIESLGAYAFSNCTSLKSILLNNGLNKISNNAFDNCSALEGISIPSTVTSLGNMAFRNATQLKELTLSVNLTSIGNSAFQNCASLTDIQLGKSITSIGNYAFAGCERLKSLAILGDITDFGSSAFQNCHSLEEIYFASKKGDNLGKVNYIFFDAGVDGNGITLTIAKDSVIPDGLFTPCNDKNMPKITKIVVEEGSTKVNGFSNYNELPYLESIIYPATITDPCYGIFNNSLWWKNQDEGMVYIEKIFYGYKCKCNMPTFAERSDTVYESTCATLGFCYNVLYCSVCKNDLSKTRGTIPTSTTHDVVDGSCTVCGRKESSEGLEYRILADGTYMVTGIGSFAEADLMIDIYNNKSVTAIDSNVFRNCESITSVTLGKDINKINSYAFQGCSALEGVYITDIAAWCGISFQSLYSNPTTLARNLYLNGELVTDLVIPDSVSTINNYAFAYCQSLKSVKLGKEVKSIGNNAFYYCSYIESITLPDNLTKIGNYAFYYCRNLESITIPSGITEISDFMFYGCSKLNNVIIPDGVTEIGRNAFYNCSSLTDLTIPYNVSLISNSAFYYCRNLKNVTFENPFGWQYFSSLSSTDGTQITVNELSDTETAATYLTTTYRTYYWRRL